MICRNPFCLLLLVLTVLGCGLAEPKVRPLATPAAYIATMQLPGDCGATMSSASASGGSNCTVYGDVDELRAGRAGAVVGFFDDALMPESWGIPADWAESHAYLARAEMLVYGSHNGRNAEPVAIATAPRDLWPEGAVFCGRVDWEGRDQAFPELMTNSREYTCFRRFAPGSGYQFVQFEIVEYRPQGHIAASVDPQATADAIFASLTLGGN